MLKFLAAVAMLGSMVGAGGGTLAAKLHGATPRVPTVKIALGKSGPANRLSVPGVALAAGDRLQRPFDLDNRGTKPLTAVSLTSRARVSSLLSSDRVNGLRLRLTRCSRAFVRRPAGYGCPGKTTMLLRTRPVLVSGAKLTGLARLAPKRSAHLLLTLVLPAVAPNAFQGKQTALTYTFTGV